MSGHTKGPWKIEVYPDANNSHAWMAYRLRGQFLVGPKITDRDLKEAKANANVMRAAPDLLEAARQAKALLEKQLEQAKLSMSVPVLIEKGPILTALEDAITKAEGRLP